MPITAQTPINSYSGNGVTVLFAYGFKVLDDDEDIEVIVDGVVKTLTTHYSVSGVGADGGGNVTFVTAPPSGTANVILRRNMDYKRTAYDYQDNGDLAAQTLDDDLDSIVMLVQQLKSELARSLKLSVDTTTDQVITQTAAARVGKLISFDASGNVSLSAPADLSLQTVSSFIAALLDDTSAAVARATLGAAAAGANTDITSLSAPVLGAATATTPDAGDNSTRVATTAFVNSGIRQIQPISASVNANALTISASALSLDFRSVTLGSGTVSKVSGTPPDLVISSGSTLGTVNATKSRIVVLALNNAGTLELAAVNISGGVDLSETGVISTTAEGGAGAADSASVVYSTTARSNLAYRVIGYIESTQATAGTWATAPSTIQGAGGQAVLAVESGRTWQDVIGSRSAGTTYYNTTGRDIDVSVTVAAGGGGNQYITVGGVVADSNTANVTVSLTSTIPPGASYVVTAIGAVSRWAELR